MRLPDKSLGRLFCLFFSVSLMLSSCSKRERSLVGISQYPDSLLLSPDTPTLDSLVFDSTYHHFIPTGSSRTLLLGFEEEYEAWALLRFEHELSNYDSAKLDLSLAEPLSDSLELGLHRISGDWDDTSVVWPFQDYEWTPLIQTSFSPGETLIVIDCPPPETIVSEEDTILSWNLLFIPTSGGMARLNARESDTRPTIWFYEDTDTTYIHSLTDAYVINYEGELDTSLLWIGSGWVLRSDLKFDISTLPPNSIINKAALILQADTITKWMEIVAFVPGAGISAIGYLNSGATSTSLLVTDLVQYWVSSGNSGLTLKTTDETEAIRRAGFFSSDYSDKRPIIRVTYTEKVYED